MLKPSLIALGLFCAIAQAQTHESSAALWVWGDKYVYQPGERMTVRWTVKTNGDQYPYTIVAYRQNNQTGARAYLPNDGGTPTDLAGRTVDKGFERRTLVDAAKQPLLGDSAVTLPEEFGMHTIVVELRDENGGRILRSAYFKFGVVRGFEDLPNNITESRRLTNDTAYRIRGIVAVRNNAVLSIDPGIFLIGMPGSQPPSVLLITTQGRIEANGTRSRPIIMTSSQPFGQRQRGDWGGLILLGSAPVNDPGKSLQIEGLPDLPETRYGGDSPNHNCGAVRYVRVEFAGALLRPNEETNSFTWGGCGKQTVTEFVQSHYGLDDAFEWFGGNNDAKYLVGTYAADDYVDVQVGYTGRIQYVLAASNEDLSNRGVEADNYERDFAARPLGKAQMWNMTFLGGGNRGFDETDAPCLYFRRGAGGITNNVLCYRWTTRTIGGANFDSILPNITAGDFSIDGILAWNNGQEAQRVNSGDAQVTADWLPFARGEVGHGRNFLFGDPVLRRPDEKSDPDPLPASLGSPVFRATWVQPPDDGFFDQSARYIGAFGEDNWTEEWTTFIQEQDLKQ